MTPVPFFSASTLIGRTNIGQLHMSEQLQPTGVVQRSLQTTTMELTKDNNNNDTTPTRVQSHISVTKISYPLATWVSLTGMRSSVDISRQLPLPGNLRRVIYVCLLSRIHVTYLNVLAATLNPWCTSSWRSLLMQKSKIRNFSLKGSLIGFVVWWLWPANVY
jgi:hypothetical protein